ncbi:MAG: hypothetical protein NC222_07030 [Staphylococcus sp.]|nr:hypothetical protein [Staphylococcus sp.]
MKLVFEKEVSVASPKKAHKEDAGIDFYIPNDLAYIIQKGKGINIGVCTKEDGDGNELKETAIEVAPHKSVLIPLGIKVKIPEQYCMVFFNRSGIAAKKCFYRGAGVIDSNFRGTLMLNLTNVSDKTQYINVGEKIIQGLILPVPSIKITEGKVENDTERGEGGFGSTNHK